MAFGLNGPVGLHVPEPAQIAKLEKPLRERPDPVHALILLRPMVERIVETIMKTSTSVTRKYHVVSCLHFLFIGIEDFKMFNDLLQSN